MQLLPHMRLAFAVTALAVLVTVIAACGTDPTATPTAQPTPTSDAHSRAGQ